MFAKIAGCTMAAAVLGLAATALAAPAGVTLSPDKAVTLFHGAPFRPTLPQWTAPARRKTIVNTLGAGDAYDSTQGWTIANLPSGAGEKQWVAFPMTPTSNTTVTEIVEAISYVMGTCG